MFFNHMVLMLPVMWFGIDRKAVAKLLQHSIPPGYQRCQPPKRPKLYPFISLLPGISLSD